MEDTDHATNGLGSTSFLQLFLGGAELHLRGRVFERVLTPACLTFAVDEEHLHPLI